MNGEEYPLVQEGHLLCDDQRRDVVDVRPVLALLQGLQLRSSSGKRDNFFIRAVSQFARELFEIEEKFLPFPAFENLGDFGCGGMSPWSFSPSSSSSSKAKRAFTHGKNIGGRGEEERTRNKDEKKSNFILRQKESLHDLWCRFSAY